MGSALHGPTSIQPAIALAVQDAAVVAAQAHLHLLVAGIAGFQRPGRTIAFQRMDLAQAMRLCPCQHLLGGQQRAAAVLVENLTGLRVT